MMRRALCAMVVCLLVVWGTGACPAWGGDPTPAQSGAASATLPVTEQSQAEALLGEVRVLLDKRFGLTVQRPVTVTLLDSKDLEQVIHTYYPSSNASTGIHSSFERSAEGKHHLWVLKGLTRDQCVGAIAHECAHAWQAEHVRRNQSIVVVVGFSRWIQYKVYWEIGAGRLAQELREQVDPLYGYGLQKFLELEDKKGEQGVLEFARTAKTF